MASVSSASDCALDARAVAAAAALAALASDGDEVSFDGAYGERPQ